MLFYVLYKYYKILNLSFYIFIFIAKILLYNTINLYIIMPITGGRSDDLMTQKFIWFSVRVGFKNIEWGLLVGVF